MKPLPSLAIVALACGPAAGQLPVDGWAYTAEFISIGLLDANLRPITSLGGSLVQTDIIADGDGGSRLYYSGVQVTYDPSNPNNPFPLSGVMRLIGAGPRATYLAETRDFIWFIDFRDGSLWKCLKDVPNQTPIAVSNPVVQLGINGLVADMCTNGREVFFSVVVSANDTHHVFAVDVRDPSHPARPVASLPVGPSPRGGPGLALARDGMLLAQDDPLLYRIDPRTGRLTPLMSRPTSGPYANGVVMAYNPWTDAVAFGTGPLYPFMQMTAQNLTSGAGLGSASAPTRGYGLTSTAVRPFELFGMGCPNSTGRDPRMGWQGLPRQGQTFTLTLRDAEPNGVAVFWLGLSDGFWAPVGPLPFAAGALGAPGCRMYVSGDVPYFVPVDAAGQASHNFPVPVNPSLVGWELYAQTVSSSGANNLGFASSDALVIRLR